MSAPAVDLEALRQLGERVRPLSAAQERTLPVPEAFGDLLPLGGLQRGSRVCTAGCAATSLALALAGPATVAGSWCAVVGLGDLGLLAAAELGLTLERTLLVAEPGPQEWAGAVAALLDAVEVVLVRPAHRITPTTQRRLVARARDRGSVLIHAGGSAEVWAHRPDLVLTADSARWVGLGAGHGRLRGRRVTVAVDGRRGAAQTRSASVWLPGPDGQIARVADAPVASSPRAASGPEVSTLRDAG